MPSSLLGALWVVPALPLLGFLLNGALALWRPHAKTAVSAIGVGVLVLACAAAVAAVAGFAGLHPAAPLVFRYWEWMPVGELRVDFALQVDQLSLVMLLVVTGVGSLIHLFSIGYMKEDPGYARYFAYLNLFVFFMLVLVLGASFPVMFVGWEGVGLCSYLLIGFWFNEQINADAGKKAFIVNRIGDVGFLIAMFLIFRATGSLDLAARLHVRGRRHGRVRRRDLSPRDARVLQGAVVPGLGQRDPRHAPRVPHHPRPRRCAGHAEHGRAATLSPLDRHAHVDRDARDRRHPTALRLLLQGRDPRCGVRARDGRARLARVLGDGRRGGLAHGVLHDATDAVHLPRPEPDGRARASAPARGAVGDDGPARGAGRAQSRGGVLNLPELV